MNQYSPENMIKDRLIIGGKVCDFVLINPDPIFLLKNFKLTNDRTSSFVYHKTCPVHPICLSLTKFVRLICLSLIPKHINYNFCGNQILKLTKVQQQPRPLVPQYKLLIKRKLVTYIFKSPKSFTLTYSLTKKNRLKLTL